mmetsp:Transcript_152347/g.283827  ORF Transcript_152347/g.283827 Transcript_152347/m.283827 type:complete len:120 (+) Transcript_152347:2-361(+)
MGPVISVSFSSDSCLVATGALDDTARVWNVATGANIQTCVGHQRQLWSAEFARSVQRQVPMVQASIVTAVEENPNNNTMSAAVAGLPAGSVATGMPVGIPMGIPVNSAPSTNVTGNSKV